MVLGHNRCLLNVNMPTHRRKNDTDQRSLLRCRPQWGQVLKLIVMCLAVRYSF